MRARVSFPFLAKMAGRTEAEEGPGRRPRLAPPPPPWGIDFCREIDLPSFLSLLLLLRTYLERTLGEKDPPPRGSGDITLDVSENKIKMYILIRENVVPHFDLS